MPFTTDLPTTLEDTIHALERDFPFPEHRWYLGRCNCDNPGGTHRAVLERIGTAITGMAIMEVDIITGRVEHFDLHTNSWELDAHGTSPIEALRHVHGLALNKEPS